MPESFVQILRDWQNFYSLTGTAAATLVGLQFVAVSLAVSGITEKMVRGVQTFVTPTLVHFIYVLVIAALLTAPLPGSDVLSGLLVLMGLVGLGLIAPRARELLRIHRDHALDRDHWVWYFLVPLAGYVLILGAAVGILLAPPPSFFVLGAAILLLLVVGIHNAWDLVLWIALQRPR